jgi:ferredoxin
MKATQKIVIDEKKCIGCGQCVNACPGGALELVDGKARLTHAFQCDGLGVCIGECPVDAISFEDVEVSETRPEPAARPAAGGCPGSAARSFAEPAAASPDGAPAEDVPSALTHWPLQLKLISPTSPAYAGADVLIAADCTAFSVGAFHGKLLAGRSLIIACPKLDDPTGYVEKLERLLREARPASVTVARMEVPCCAGLVEMVRRARDNAGSDLELREVILGLQGDVKSERTL